jgi:hypothetical protein
LYSSLMILRQYISTAQWHINDKLHRTANIPSVLPTTMLEETVITIEPDSSVLAALMRTQRGPLLGMKSLHVSSQGLGFRKALDTSRHLAVMVFAVRDLPMRSKAFDVCTFLTTTNQVASQLPHTRQAGCVAPWSNSACKVLNGLLGTRFKLWRSRDLTIGALMRLGPNSYVEE